MFKILLALHVLFAIFAIGPLVGIVTTASRGLRDPDASATAAAARGATTYAYVSVLVVLFGFGLMSADNPYGPGKVAEFGELWIWLSVLLWVVATALTLGVVVPALKQATTRIGAGEPAESVRALTGRVAAAGGAVGLIFAGIVFLMVYQPGG